MKLVLYTVLFLQCMNFIATSSISCKPQGRHSRILHKKQRKLGLRDSGQTWPDRYGYDPRIPLA